MATDDSLSGTFGFLNEMHKEDDSSSDLLLRSLVNNLFVLLRTGFMHDLKNDALRPPLNALANTVDLLYKERGEKVVIDLIDGNFFIMSRLLELDFSTYQNTQYLVRIFEYLDVDQMVFTRPVTADELLVFVGAFVDVVRGDDKEITDYDLGSIRIGHRTETSFDEMFKVSDPRHQVLRVYTQGLLMLRRVVNDLRMGRAPQYSKVKRLCMQMIDLESRYHNLLLALVHVEGYKGNLFSHMLNTAVLSIAFARRLGLPKQQLLEIGMGAFYHDLGWALIGAREAKGIETDVALTMDGINDIRNDDASDIEEIRIKVARTLVRLGGLNELLISRLIVGYECQVPESEPSDGLYYGDIGANYMTDLVRMASVYDKLTTQRGDGDALRPDIAMKHILDDEGQTYDEFLAKLFAQFIGAYPIGTMVEMDTGELGMVVNLPTDPVYFNRPQVKLLLDRSGDRLDSGEVVDLSDKYRDGRFTRSIERTIDCRDYRINISRFFFG